jgi:hypothetical protein
MGYRYLNGVPTHLVYRSKLEADVKMVSSGIFSQISLDGRLIE